MSDNKLIEPSHAATSLSNSMTTTKASSGADDGSKKKKETSVNSHHNKPTVSSNPKEPAGRQRNSSVMRASVPAAQQEGHSPLPSPPGAYRVGGTSDESTINNAGSPSEYNNADYTNQNMTLIEAQAVTVYDAVVSEIHPSTLNLNEIDQEGGSDSPTSSDGNGQDGRTMASQKRRKTYFVMIILAILLVVAIVLVLVVLDRSSAKNGNDNQRSAENEPTFAPPTMAPTLNSPTEEPPSTPSPTLVPTTRFPTIAPTLSPQWELFGQPLRGVEESDRFGTAVSVAANGLKVAVGSPYKGPQGEVQVYAYSTDNFVWYTDSPVILQGDEATDVFGASVGLAQNGNILVVGAPNHSAQRMDSIIISTGLVRVYQRFGHPVGWAQIGADVYGNAWDALGAAVAVSHDGYAMVAGAPGDPALSIDPGNVQAFVYNQETFEWEGRGQRISGKDYPDSFGTAVAMSADGMTLAAGADYGSDGTGNGYARVYTFDSGLNEWVQMGQELVGSESRDRFGRAVSLSDDGLTLAVGSVSGSYGSVHVYAYNQDSLEWEQVGQTLFGDSLQENLGVSVSLSADGRTVAAGATQSNDGTGSVRIYRYNTFKTTWEANDAELSSEAKGDRFGSALSLSANGRTIVVGTPEYGNSTGQVQVFRTR